jgi:hypothetical protein
MHVVGKINNFPLPRQEEYLLPVLIFFYSVPYGRSGGTDRQVAFGDCI